MSNVGALQRQHGISAKLVFIYFLADRNQKLSGPNHICPATEDEWRDSLDEQDKHLGLSGQISDQRGIHQPVAHQQCRDRHVTHP